MTHSHSIYILEIFPSFSGHFSEKSILSSKISMEEAYQYSTSIPKDPKVTVAQNGTHPRSRTVSFMGCNFVVVVVQARVELQRKEDKDKRRSQKGSTY